MADRYQDRPLPADDDYDRGDDQRAPANDPLAELARLIGQTDPFAMGRANHPVVRGGARDQHDHDQDDQYDDREPADDGVAAGPPPWMRAARHEPAPQDYPSSVHPLQRYAAQHAAPQQDYHPAPAYADEADHEPDPARYDDALYGQPDSGTESQHDPAYPDDPYGYQDGYGEAAEPPVRKRGGMATVVVVLALAVLGTGGAFAYRTYVGSPRSGETPIIKADPNPIKVMPTAADGSGKVPDRLAAAGDGTEKIVPREEAPVDINAKGGGPRVVFPPLNQNTNPPSASSVAPGSAPPPGSGNGTLPSNEPRKIKTFSVAGDTANGIAAPATAAPPAPAKPAPAARVAPAPSTATPAPRAAAPPSSANASANAPLSLSPQAAQTAPAPEPRTRVATVAPATQAAPAPAGGGGGGYLVQISSQRNEADAQASFKAMQGKFPAVLGSRAPLIKRADLGEKGIYFRAMVGPFGSADEASQFCGSLKTAGGQCVIQRN
jgi:hypothetical protein